MKTHRFSILSLSTLALGGALAGLMSGCLGPQSQMSLDEIQNSVSSQPYVEAYIEYGSPQEKWSGPTAFMLHINAKETGTAQLTLTPQIVGQAKPEATLILRTPASVEQSGMSANIARDHLSELATALQGPEHAFSGCLNPIRVRLIRQDGALTEKQGCRGYGWSRSASEKVDAFTTAYYGK